MGGLALLPGEREVLHLRPSPLGWLSRYSLALLPAAWGGLLWLLFHASFWTGENFRAIVLGSIFAAHFDNLVLMALGGWIARRILQRRAPLQIALAIAVTASLSTLLAGLPYRDALPAMVALGSVPLLAWMELQRLGTHHHITNLRLTVRTTFPRRGEHSERHAELGDIDVRQAPWDRALDVGTLLPVSTPPSPQPVRMVGVRPLSRVLHLIQVLVRQATATDYLRERQGLEKQQAEALAALQRR